MIFDMKQDSRRKARLVMGGHVLDSSTMETYASVMKAISERLLLVIASANNYELLAGDIKNAYLYANCDIDVYTRVGPKFKLAGYKELSEGCLAKIERALYGLPTSGQNWHIHLDETLRGMGFKPTRYDPNVYMRSNKDSSSYDYLGCHTNDITVMAKDAQAVIDQLMRSYEITKPSLPVYNIGCTYSKEVVKGREMCHIGSDTHVQEAIKKAEDLLGT